MKAKFGAIITDGRGKIGGKVFSKNRYGNYEKTKVSPINKPSVYKDQIKANHRLITAAWSGLTDNQRQTWISGTLAFPQKNTFADIFYLSGFGLFLKLNLNRLIIGQSLLKSCPNMSLFTSIISASFEARDIDNTLILTYSPLCPAEFIYKVHATPPVSAGISYSNRRFKLIGLIKSTDSSPMDISTWYLTRYSAISPVGSKIFLKITPIEIATGIESQPFIIHSLILNSLDMLKATINFSAVEAIAMTEKTIIPAPGIKKIIVPISVVSKLFFHGTAFSFNPDVSYPQFNLRNEDAGSDGNILPSSLMVSDHDISMFVMTVQPQFGYNINNTGENKALTIRQTDALLGGNSSLSFDVYYVINEL